MTHWSVQRMLGTTVYRLLSFLRVDAHIAIITVIFTVIVLGVDGP